MKKPVFIENQIYHIFNRGVEKRNVFSKTKDYLRFIHNLFEFNNEYPVLNMNYYFNAGKTSQIPSLRKPRKLLVEILIFTLMPNHFHLVLKQKKENGIVKFMQKLGTGYTMYFNQKYQRVGALFQGRFKATFIQSQAHFLYLPHYLHATNPLSNYGGSTSIDSKMKFLENYRWSSFPDYIGKKKFPSVTQKEFFLEFFGGKEKYKKETERFLIERNDNYLNEIKDIAIENYGG